MPFAQRGGNLQGLFLPLRAIKNVQWNACARSIKHEGKRTTQEHAAI